MKLQTRVTGMVADSNDDNDDGSDDGNAREDVHWIISTEIFR